MTVQFIPKAVGGFEGINDTYLAPKYLGRYLISHSARLTKLGLLTDGLSKSCVYLSTQAR